MGLFKFEIKKIISSKKIIILWSIGMILISLYAFMSNSVDRSIKGTNINTYNKLIDDLNVNITSLNNSIIVEEDPLIKEAMEKSLIKVKEILRLNEEIKDGIINNNSKKIIEAQIEILESQRNGKVLKEEVSAISLEEIDIEIEKYNYLNNNNIEPINDGMAMTGINFINLVLKYIAPMLLGIIIILSTADIVSKETDYGTIQTLLFQKISRKKILMSKLLACILINIVCFIIVLITLATFLSLRNGVGNLSYPSIVDVGGKLVIYPVWSLILNNLLITLVYVIFLSCFSALISILSKNSIESMCISITVCIGAAILFNNIELPQWIKNINPFNYLAGNEILKTGFSSSSITTDNNAVITSVAFIAYTIIVVLLSFMKFNKKEFEIES